MSSLAARFTSLNYVFVAYMASEWESYMGEPGDMVITSSHK